MSKFTIKEFRKQYPNDAACLDRIFQIRYGKIDSCPSCGHIADFRRVTTRKCYQCRFCYHQLYPCAGTIFHKSSTPLTYWFYAIWLLIVTRNGVSAKTLERNLGVTYKCAWRILHKIRNLMGNDDISRLTGFVELDETYYSTYRDKKNKNQISKNSHGRSTDDKTPIFGMVERRGKVIAKVVDDVKKETLYPIIESKVDKQAKVFTDEYPGYVNLHTLGYNHGMIKHELKRYREGEISTNTIEGYFSQIKRMIGGTHTWVSQKWLQNYVNEACFRYNHRGKGNDMFNTLIGYLNKEKTE